MAKTTNIKTTRRQSVYPMASNKENVETFRQSIIKPDERDLVVEKMLGILEHLLESSPSLSRSAVLYHASVYGLPSQQVIEIWNQFSDFLCRRNVFTEVQGCYGDSIFVRTAAPCAANN